MPRPRRSNDFESELTDEIKNAITELDIDAVREAIDDDPTLSQGMLQFAISVWVDNEEAAIVVAELLKNCEVFEIVDALAEMNREDDLGMMLSPVIISENKTLLEEFCETKGSMNHLSEDVFDILETKVSPAELLYFVSRDGVLNFVKKLIEADNNLVNEKVPSKSGSSSLHGAAWHTQLEVVKYLLSVGADANQVNDKEESPLRNALQKGDVDVSFTLMEKSSLDNIIESTRKQECQDTSLYLAAKVGNLEAVKAIVDLGGNGLSQQARSGSTPSHAAAYYRNADCLIFLIQKFPESCNIRNTSFGEHVFTNALLIQSVEALKLLVQHTNDDAMLNPLFSSHKYCSGNTLMHLAVLAGKESLINKLVELKVDDLRTKNNEGKTPYDVGVANGASASILDKVRGA
eukprot:TRINITY_DN409_c1_g1_i2.p1 TRINITY_DN409_c1_g1~~TRINITY_DN409_c1_g1_i2.p1  ORF type:complete len:425 (+),score=109.11 TRINITY_DN409_c1_g1_i2:63-1277(+)